MFFKEQVRPGLDANIPADKSSVLVFGKLLSLLFALYEFNLKPVEAINIFISYCKETQQDIEFVLVRNLLLSFDDHLSRLLTS